MFIVVLGLSLLFLPYASFESIYNGDPSKDLSVILPPCDFTHQDQVRKGEMLSSKADTVLS